MALVSWSRTPLPLSSTANVSPATGRIEIKGRQEAKVQGRKSPATDFPGGSVAKTPHFQVQSPGGSRSHMLKVRSHMPQLKDAVGYDEDQ